MCNYTGAVANEIKIHIKKSVQSFPLNLGRKADLTEDVINWGNITGLS